jgi:hypothetical protein
MKVDLDSVHLQRVKAVKKRLESEEVPISELFLSEKVANTVGDDKVFMDGFQIEKILSLLPYTPNLYLGTCPYCIFDSESARQFLCLVKEGLIVPVLAARYQDFPDAIIDEVKKRDHISWYEASVWQTSRTVQIANGGLCKHCVSKRKKEILKPIRGNRRVSDIRLHVSNIMQNLEPFFAPDYEILDEVQAAVAERDTHS